MDANGAGRRRLFVRCCGGGVFFPIWSPDGKHIAFSASFAKQEVSGIYLMDAAGSHVHRVRIGYLWWLIWQPIP